jgi:methylated-DNA-[protein]-cysteine S-methyltransferase
MRWTELPAPIDPVGLAADDTGICAVHFGGAPVEAGPLLTTAPDGILGEARDELRRYFGGEAVDFAALPLSVRGGTDFERAVWKALSGIPYGEMRTYGQIAAEVGEPDAARAVGTACNRNPLPIVVPCHRVVAQDATIGGFSSGLPAKRRLLTLEGSLSRLRPSGQHR